MRYLVLGGILGTLLVLIGAQYGIKTALERIYYGPDKSDCIRIEGCRTGDAVIWYHHDTQTGWACIDNEWLAYSIEAEDEQEENEKF